MAKRSNNVPKDGRAKNGGPRKGQGRPLGSATKLTRRKADELCDSNESPLDVMVYNMLFWFRATKGLETQLQDFMREFAESEVMRKSPESVEEFMKLMKHMVAARENSQKCAVDAAPYVHPRLASVTLKNDPKEPLTMILGSMSAAQAAEEYAKTLRAAPESIKPLLQQRSPA